MFRPSSGAGDIPGKMVKNAWYGMKVNSRTQWLSLIHISVLRKPDLDDIDFEKKLEESLKDL